MAITLRNYKMAARDKEEGRYYLTQNRVIDLRTAKLSKSDEFVLYAPSDIKKLARAKKITYVQALAYFREVGIDDHNGAGIYVPRE